MIVVKKEEEIKVLQEDYLRINQDKYKNNNLLLLKIIRVPQI